jgi:hypothetical protein
MIDSPGALRSTAGLEFENDEDFRSALTAAIVSTWGSEAGNSSGLPASNSLPAAATGTIPRRTASWIALYSARHKLWEP